ncbi:MAG: hypothetical protein HY397_02885 [Candidatus Doudnabacteria bacterium]|nr:hypothetical protein [Candidatus Doudnabacteria bacterium]
MNGLIRSDRFVKKGNKIVRLFGVGEENLADGRLKRHNYVSKAARLGF